MLYDQQARKVIAELQVGGGWLGCGWMDGG